MVTLPVVLVGDDDEVFSAMISAALREEGYQVVVAAGGDIVTVAQQLRPHLILLDIMMPGMRGAAVSSQLRANPETAAIPIIALSGVTDFPTLTVGMQVDDMLRKPFHLDDLYAMVAQWVKHF